MKSYADFLKNPLSSVTDKADKSTLSNFRRTKDKSSQAKTGISPTDKTDQSLDASMRRLDEAGIRVAIWEDGSMRILTTQAERLQAVNDQGTIYGPKDMLMYVRLNESERRMLHDFKKRFPGSVEWIRHAE